MWHNYFKFIRLVPGRVITARFGELDFSGDVPIEICKALYEDDFPYLEITEEGKNKLYGDEIKGSDPVFEPLPDTHNETEKEKTSIPISKTKVTRKQNTRKNTKKPD